VDTLPIEPGTVRTIYLEDVPFPLPLTWGDENVALGVDPVFVPVP
jgi:hypothetical protein